MLSLFDKSVIDPSFQIKVPQWDYIQRGYKRNLAKVINYERTRPAYLPNQHYLTRFITSFPIPKTLGLERYFVNVDSYGLNYTKNFGMSSSIHSGSLFKGIFYNNSTEAILATDNYVDFEKAHANWKNLVGVKPLLSPKSDFSLHIPNGKENTSEYGSVVLEINLPLLMIQYRAFYLEQMAREDELTKTASQFVSMYVLPNMLEQQANLAIFNKLFKIHFGIPDTNEKPLVSKPYALVNYDSFIHKALEDTLDIIKKSPRRFESVLSIIPSFTKNSFYEAVLLPDLIPNRNVTWTAMMSKLKVIFFLLDICGTKADRHHINEFKKMIDYSGVKQIFNQKLPAEMKQEMLMYIDAIETA